MKITQNDMKVANFFVKVGGNPELTKELITLKDPDKIITFAHHQGFDFTVNELKEGVGKLEELETRQGTEELTDEQLDNVAGGESYVLWYLWEGTKEGAKAVAHSVGDALVSAGEALKRV